MRPKGKSARVAPTWGVGVAQKWCVVGVLAIVAAGGTVLNPGCGGRSGSSEPQDGGLDGAMDGGGEADSGPVRPARALLLDQEFRHVSAWVDLMEGFEAAGVQVTYRRFYPHLTQADIEPEGGEYPYGVIVMAAGRMPSNPSSVMRYGEIQNAIGHVQSGGALVLVSQSSWTNSYTAENDFFVQNRILEELEVPVRIDRNTVIGEVWEGDPAPPHQASDWAYPTPLEFTLGYPYLLTHEDARVAAGSVPTLRVASDQVQVLLRTYDSGYIWHSLGPWGVGGLWDNFAVAAAVRAGPGFVVVAPRGTLTVSAASTISDKPAMDPDRWDVNRNWVRFFAGYVSGLVSGAVPFEVTVSRDADTLFSVQAPGRPALDPDGEVFEIQGPVSNVAVPATPPAGDLTEEIPLPPPSPRQVPDWFGAGGGRVAYGGLTSDGTSMSEAFDEVVTHGIDVLMTSTSPSRLLTLTGPQLTAEQAMYADYAGRAEIAGARWFVGGYLVGVYLSSDPRLYPKMVGSHGGETDAPAPLNQAYWNDVLIPMFVAVGDLAGSNPGIAGLHIDLELYNGPVWHHDGWAFSDDTLEAYLATVSDSELAETLRNADPSERLDLLKDRGLFKDYMVALEQAAYQFAVACRQAARTAAPDLEMMVYAPGYPNTWFYRGLLRGLGTADRPVTVMTYDGWAGRASDLMFAEGIPMAHLGGTIVGHWTPADFEEVLVSLSFGNDGYWYFTFNDFSATNPNPPAMHGTSAEYWAAVDAANGRLQ